MTKFLTALFCGSFFSFNSYRILDQTNSEWNNNPEVFQINRLLTHLIIIPYSNISEAFNGDMMSSLFYFLRQGTWKFQLISNSSQRVITVIVQM